MTGVENLIAGGKTVKYRIGSQERMQAQSPVRKQARSPERKPAQSPEMKQATSPEKDTGIKYRKASTKQSTRQASSKGKIAK